MLGVGQGSGNYFQSLQPYVELFSCFFLTFFYRNHLQERVQNAKPENTYSYYDIGIYLLLFSLRTKFPFCR